ncbi:MAG: hypothetical protein G01um101425_858 [Candidatus Peregrinibacteria bacterium Gr01-1014_25]|nr:MAG: hypothetical protein G01um101425_858 [Candidatus Peregrinibacteria bacterium Gr01-1014_25]
MTQENIVSREGESYDQVNPHAVLERVLGVLPPDLRAELLALDDAQLVSAIAAYRDWAAMTAAPETFLGPVNAWENPYLGTDRLAPGRMQSQELTADELKECRCYRDEARKIVLCRYGLFPQIKPSLRREEWDKYERAYGQDFLNPETHRDETGTSSLSPQQEAEAVAEHAAFGALRELTLRAWALRRAIDERQPEERIALLSRSLDHCFRHFYVRYYMREDEHRRMVQGWVASLHPVWRRWADDVLRQVAHLAGYVQFSPAAYQEVRDGDLSRTNRSRTMQTGRVLRIERPVLYKVDEHGSRFVQIPGIVDVE